MTKTFEVITRTVIPVAELFARSLDIDTHQESLADSHERAVDGVTSGSIGLGESVTWRARHWGIWFTMTSEITELNAPTTFTDRQRSGPFREFVHTHEFAEVGGRTEMIDRIRLASPVFGFVAEPLILVPYLRRLIRQRNRFLTRDDPSATVV